MKQPPDKYGHQEPRSFWRPVAIGVAVFALLSTTFVILLAVAFVMSMNSFGNNK